MSPSGRYLNCLRLDPGQRLYLVNFILSIRINDCFTLPTEILNGFEMILCQISKLRFTQTTKKSGEMCENSCPYLFSIFGLYAKTICQAGANCRDVMANTIYKPRQIQNIHLQRLDSENWFLWCQPTSSCLFGSHLGQ